MLFVTLDQPIVHAHDDYRSVSHLEWNDADGSVELVIEIHRHPLETKLSLLLDQRLSFLSNDDYGKLEVATKNYLAKNIVVDVDGEPVNMVFLGLETKGETVIAYLEADWPDQPQSLGFMNSIFLDDLPEQINTVLATVMGTRFGGDITGAGRLLRFDF